MSLTVSVSEPSAVKSSGLHPLNGEGCHKQRATSGFWDRLLMGSAAGIGLWGCMMLSAALAAAENGPVEPDAGFPWGIHLITVPAVLLFGIFIGWSLRERMAAQQDAMREIEKKA